MSRTGCVSKMYVEMESQQQDCTAAGGPVIWSDVIVTEDVFEEIQEKISRKSTVQILNSGRRSVPGTKVNEELMSSSHVRKMFTSSHIHWILFLNR